MPQPPRSDARAAPGRPTGAVLGVGMEMAETPRLERLLARDADSLRRRVFTAAEWSDCAGDVDRAQALSARLAAKEAFLKAIGGSADGIALSQVEVVGGDRGRPALRLHGAAAERAEALGVRRTHLSLTDLPGLAAAVVVLEG